MSRPSARLRRAETSPPSRSRRRWYETRLCCWSASSHSSPTRRSLRASSLNSRHRSGWPTSHRNRGGEGVSARAVATTPWTIHQTHLMRHPGVPYRRQSTSADQRRADDRERLGSAAEQLLSSEGWQRWVRVRSRNGLARYSVSNQLLIATAASRRRSSPVSRRGWSSAIASARVRRRSESSRGRRCVSAIPRPARRPTRPGCFQGGVGLRSPSGRARRRRRAGVARTAERAADR